HVAHQLAVVALDVQHIVDPFGKAFERHPFLPGDGDRHGDVDRALDRWPRRQPVGDVGAGPHSTLDDLAAASERRPPGTSRDGAERDSRARGDGTASSLARRPPSYLGDRTAGLGVRVSNLARRSRSRLLRTGLRGRPFPCGGLVHAPSLLAEDLSDLLCLLARAPNLRGELAELTPGRPHLLRELAEVDPAPGAQSGAAEGDTTGD